MTRNTTSEVRVLIGPVGSIDALLRDIDALAAHGVKVPKTFTAVRESWDAVRLDSKNAQQKLADAIAAGRLEDVPALLTTVAISRNANLAEIKNAVARDVLKALTSIWQSEGAEAAYAKVAADFDAVAKKLTECASIVNIEASAESLVRDRLDKEQQDAWLAAREYAARLDELLGLLQVAAELLPIPSERRQSNLPDGTPSDWLLALSCDPGVAHRRNVWGAWESHGECGRWGKLLDLGVTLSAHPDPRDFAIYERPAPVEVKQERSRVGGITGVKQYEVDPEDALHAERLAAQDGTDARS